MLNVSLAPDHATVSLVGELSEQLAVELVDRIEWLHRTCFYTRIELEIASPGGAIVALDHCVDGMRRLREAGVRISTRALTAAASAAAILVSLGDRRAAMPRSLLLYHMGRVDGVRTVTADSGSQMVEALHEADRHLVALLVDRARRKPESGARPDNVLSADDLRQGDWGVVARLVGTVRGKDGEDARKASLKKLRKKVASALGDAKDAKLTKLYATLFLLDAPISAALAKELGLIDSIGAESDPVDAAEDDAGGICVPEWKAIFPPNGRVPAAALCRHTLILGETGSGKTASGILPAVSGILGERSAVGCALVIDPKTDILPVLQNLTEDPSEVRLIDVCRKSGRDVLNLMPGKLSVAVDLAEGNVLAAARKILCRGASLTENNPAKTLAGQATTSREPYWDNEGARLAQTVLAFVLIVFEHRRTLFGTETKRAALSGAPRAVRQALGELGERAGFLERSEEIEVAAADARRELGSRAAPEVVRIDFARAVRETNFYRTCKGFAQEFERLKGDCPEPRSAREFEDATRDLVDAVALASVRCPERLSSRRGGEPGPNVLALAGHALQSLFGLKSVGEARFVAAAAAERLRPLMRRGETSDVLNSIVDYWNAMADPESTGQYTGAFGHARTCFYAFADPVPAHSMYFGCEPCFEAALGQYGSNVSVLDFAASVDAKGERTIYVFQPSLSSAEDALVAKALKALFFEAVLNSEPRREPNHGMPLVAYIADECHRFVTSDLVHGEQSFLDTCRSFRAFCVLACQSVASLRHALAEANGISDSTEPAIDIILANSGNKLFFRSTDRDVSECIERLCPKSSGRSSVASVRPPSTLKPGECYAVLADGRFERRQLEQYRPSPRPAAHGAPASS